MSNNEKNHERRLIKKLIVKARKRAERKNNKIFLNAGIMGVFGWHICTPVILATILGLWLDKKFDMNGSLFIAFLIIGFMVGGYNSYRWVKETLKFKIRQKEEDSVILQDEKPIKTGEE
ncbi:MAG: putative F0F1-ATPase [Alphaproteobacteria bacterium ADurb.Bin438]|nr:MAG: putative F0F1-ATPase [Alphaproteobacteria bacterium ADurb.Bin438]